MIWLAIFLAACAERSVDLTAFRAGRPIAVRFFSILAFDLDDTVRSLIPVLDLPFLRASERWGPPVSGCTR